jgi:hypothetical protein
MNFKSFITESMDKSIPSIPGIDSEVVDKLNLLLFIELEKPILTIESGISKIRKILYLEGITFENFFDLDSEGEELAVELTDNDYLYILFYLTEEGYYDFYAEVTDENGIVEAMSETEGEEIN